MERIDKLLCSTGRWSRREVKEEMAEASRNTMPAARIKMEAKSRHS